MFTHGGSEEVGLFSFLNINWIMPCTHINSWPFSLSESWSSFPVVHTDLPHLYDCTVIIWHFCNATRSSVLQVPTVAGPAVQCARSVCRV